MPTSVTNTKSSITLEEKEKGIVDKYEIAIGPDSSIFLTLTAAEKKDLDKLAAVYIPSDTKTSREMALEDLALAVQRSGKTGSVSLGDAERLLMQHISDAAVTVSAGNANLEGPLDRRDPTTLISHRNNFIGEAGVGAGLSVDLHGGDPDGFNFAKHGKFSLTLAHSEPVNSFIPGMGGGRSQDMTSVGLQFRPSGESAISVNIHDGGVQQYGGVSYTRELGGGSASIGVKTSTSDEQNSSVAATYTNGPVTAGLALTQRRGLDAALDGKGPEVQAGLAVSTSGLALGATYNADLAGEVRASADVELPLGFRAGADASRDKDGNISVEQLRATFIVIPIYN